MLSLSSSMASGEVAGGPWKGRGSRLYAGVEVTATPRWITLLSMAFVLGCSAGLLVTVGCLLLWWPTSSISSPFSSPSSPFAPPASFAASSPDTTLRSLAHHLLPQDRVAVCINFNNPPHPVALELILRLQTQLHRWLAIVSPASSSELSAEVQQILSRYPAVSYLHGLNESRGFCQQYSLAACLQHWNAQPAHSFDGVMYLADDMWFNWLEVLVPRCQQAELSEQQGVYTSFTTASSATTRFRYPFDEVWYYPSGRMAWMKEGRERYGDWWFNETEMWPTFRSSYWALPPQWRDWLSTVSGRRHFVLTESIADVVYVPFHHQQLSNLLTVLATVNSHSFPAPVTEIYCPFSEAGMDGWLHLAMILSGRPPLVRLPDNGVYLSSSHSKLPAWGNGSSYYQEYLEYLESLDFRRRRGQAEQSQGWQLRPVPFQYYGFNFRRDDWDLLRWITTQSEGNPIAAHPLKLSNASSPATAIYTEAHTLLIQRLHAFEQDKTVRCRP